MTRRSRTRQGRFDRVDEIDALIEAWTGKHDKREAMEILAKAGVACGAVLDTGEVLADAHLRGRGMIVDLEHPERGRFPMPGNPIHMSASPTDVQLPPGRWASTTRRSSVACSASAPPTSPPSPGME